MFGVYAFFYGTLHFLIYVIADRFAGLDFPDGFVARSTARALWHRSGTTSQNSPHHDWISGMDRDGAIGVTSTVDGFAGWAAATGGSVG
jgi:hypothetical protein